MRQVFSFRIYITTYHSIWKIVSKKFRRIKFLKVIAIFWILLGPIVLVYGSYVYIKYHFTLRFIDIVTTSILIVALIMLIVILINYKYIALRKTLNVLKKILDVKLNTFLKLIVLFIDPCQLD